ncbi:phenylalanine--tRNA ligase subunit beta [Facilibium subflavum]|uniref:phenylalanine--tRNA ligase subunit beta n=1 Tax=Facilibium subflavum TaxID=2219058 RepID=UPI000E64EA3D|nr:phenylalanine--tRNA ligase subunit beta [Facilibium subflavum]
MKFSQKWLDCFLDETLETKALAEKLTLAGVEVDAIDAVSQPFQGVVVGQIITIKKHPDADKLNICEVDVNQENLLTIVCGASNIYEGMKAPVALIGAVLPGDFKIKKSKLRGQESFGMLCSAKELTIAEDAEGLLELPEEAPVGADIREYLALDDVSIEVDLTPNRADCLSVYGIAREVSALTGIHLKPLEIIPQPFVTEKTKKITLQATKACPQYYGRLIENINLDAKTPLWMQERLRRSGLRPVSVIVDITNYVLLELGQPMHAFDADKLGDEIYIRFAKEAEEIVLLDETKVTLLEGTLVIADEHKPQAIAGVMGGLDSCVDNNTKNIFLESAYFAPEYVAGKARKYGLHTDSSHRYERGVDPMLAKQAIEYATALITDIAGGKPAKVSMASDFTFNPPKVNLSLSRVNRILGVSLDEAFVEKTLTRLNMNWHKLSQSSWQVTPPSYRFDIAIEEDLIEEVGRLYGYQNLPVSMPKMQLTAQTVKEGVAESRLKTALIDRGFYETIHYSFIEPKLDAFFFDQKGLMLQNPISQDMSVMRQSLIPGLLLSFKSNLNRQQPRIRLFETGVCFHPNKQGSYNETQKIAGLAFGALTPLNWQDKKASDFYTVKSDVEALLSLTQKPYHFGVCDDIKWLHPGQSAYIYQGNQSVGLIGVLHPSVLKLMQIKAKAPIVFEMDAAVLLDKKVSSFQPISKYPSVVRDLAITVNQEIPAQSIIDTIHHAGISMLKQVDTFDVYTGQNIAEDQKSIALSLSFQADTHTLTDDEITKMTGQIIELLSTTYNATLRA